MADQCHTRIQPKYPSQLHPAEKITVMTDNTLKMALKEAYASAPTKDTIIDTLEFVAIYPKDKTAPEEMLARVVKGSQLELIPSQSDQSDEELSGLKWQAPIEDNSIQTFFPLNFDMSLAPVSSDPTPEMSITLDNVGRIFFDAFDTAVRLHKTILVTYRPYLSSRISDGPQVSPPPTLNVTSVTANLSHISIRARIFDIADRTFPSQIYENQKFPGLLA